MRDRPGDRVPPANNFEYDEQEWDIGIGDLIIDLDADIEKSATSGMASAAGGAASKGQNAKLAVEHSATVDKGLKMKIKRTKPGTKTSEAKHEIVKSNSAEQQNGDDPKGGKHPPSGATPQGTPAAQGAQGATAGSPASSGKRGSSSHRRDKVKDKSGKPTAHSATNSVSGAAPPAGAMTPDVNGVGAARPAQPASPHTTASTTTTTATASTAAGGGSSSAAATSTTTTTTPSSSNPSSTSTTTTTSASGAQGAASGPANPRTAVFTGASGPGPPATPSTPSKYNDRDADSDRERPPPAKKSKSNSEPKVSAELLASSGLSLWESDGK